MRDDRKTLGIIGLGAFGVFMAQHLSPYCRLLGCDRTPPAQTPAGLEIAPPEAVAACDIVVFAVPLDNLEDAARLAAPHIKPGSLVMDVTSVKKRPLDILKGIIPEHADLLGTHPLFGPQSGKNGIASLRIALCRVRISSERYYRVCDFLTDSLRLLVLKTDPDAHDREMARVQAMTHFMSRALREIGLEPSPMATKAYEKLQEFASIVLSDSWDLFLTIEKGNPYADGMRRRLLEELHTLEDKLAES
jgi:prephenate dehydrogenase